jgi:hypothetical protein
VFGDRYSKNDSKSTIVVPSIYDRTVSYAHVTLEERRSKGLHKVSAGTQKLLSEFGRFVDAYSGIVDIVMLVDLQHGGVACTTLALLFSVRLASNRGNRTDSLILRL